MMGPYLVPSVIIGLGEWGRTVAEGADRALKARSPVLAKACPVLALSDEEPAAAELIRAHLRASRMADVARALEQEGLMQLDPVVSPTTHVYLIGSEPDQFERTALHVSDAAAALKASVRVTAIATCRLESFAHPTYLIEPTASRGLILSPEEFTAAAIELLVALAQPGGSEILSGDLHQGAGSTGTVGIAWLDWSPTAVESALAARLSRAALLHALRIEAPHPSARASQREVGARFTPAERLPGLLRGLPFRPVVDLSDWRLEATHPLFGSPNRRRQRSVYLRRCAHVLQRRVERWERLLARNSEAVAEREAERLTEAVDIALASGRDGFARARHMVESLAGDAVRRLEAPPPADEPRRAGPHLERLAKAEALPPSENVAMLLAGVMLLVVLVGWLLHVSLATYMTWAVMLTLAGGFYHWWRPRQAELAARAAWGALTERLHVIATEAVRSRLEALDRTLETQTARLLARLKESEAELRRRCASNGWREAEERGALHSPLVTLEAVQPIYMSLEPRVAELAEHLARAECLRSWRDADLLMRRCEEEAKRFLGDSLSPEPGQLAARAYGDRLGDQLGEAVRGLLSWSQPLLATSMPLPEGRRWLVWPEGLPCPPLPPDVALLPGARSCAAAITVIPELPGERFRQIAGAS